MIGTNVYFYNGQFYIKTKHRQNVIKADDQTKLIYFLLTFGFDPDEIEMGLSQMHKHGDNFMNFGHFNDAFIITSNKSEEEITREVGLAH